VQLSERFETHLAILSVNYLLPISLNVDLWRWSIWHLPR